MQSNSEKYYEISLQAKEDAGFPNNYVSLNAEQRYFVDSLLEKSFEKDENYDIIIDEVRLAIGDLHDTKNNLVKLLADVSGDNE
jgi:hypothetical protein|tara:strand:+ start:773 stop:1024 length:252 start_codon:yes stop_codon:yes gene_type:complete